jgi:2,3-diaminopropionate biosynthesis protein SbnA
MATTDATVAPPGSALAVQSRRGVLAAVGNTALVQLTRLLGSDRFRLYAKLEAGNPGGSVKDRPALMVIERAAALGLIDSRTVVVESSSGNFGVGLAQVCRFHGLRFICVVDPKTTQQNLAIMRAYGAEVDVVLEPDPETGEYLAVRLRRVQELRRDHANSFWPNQYASTWNALAHHATMGEIADALDHRVDYLLCATSTCGTLRGCAEYVREHGLSTTIIAVDAWGSVIFGGTRAKRLLPGHGAALRPALFQEGLAQHVAHMTDLECVVGCRRLMRREAILAGASSGAVVMAAERMAPQLRAGTNCVAILADRGERYMDTVYSDAWVATHFGDVAHLWNGEGDRSHA